MRERILVVDDEPGVRAALEAILTDDGYVVVTAASGEAGLEAAREGGFAAVLLDVWLPGIDGLETLRRLRGEWPDLEVIMISGHGTVETAVRATKLGAFDFIEKPLSLERTLLVLRNALTQRRLAAANRRLVEQLARETEIVGRSAGAKRLRHAVDVAARAESPVLLLGEAGTGRETAARRIHVGSRLGDSPFVAVPCGALDPALAASALFGGGGDTSRIELARGGSLFLDDLDRLDPALQRRLAAWLAQPQPAPVRVLASAAPSFDRLEPEIRNMVDVIRIDVPALRERREDVAVLAERFMRDLAREYAREPRRLAPETIAALTAHDWPGNVVELRNVIERLVLFGTRPVIDVAELPLELGGQSRDTEDLYRDFGSLAEGLEAFERHYVRRALAESGSDLAAAARRLGLTEAALTQRLRR